MSAPLGYSLINDSENTKSNKNHCRTLRKNRSKKKQDLGKGKVDKLLNSLTQPREKSPTPLLPPPQLTGFAEEDDDDDNSAFNPEKQMQYQPATEAEESQPPLDQACTIENFTQMAESASADDYYKQYIPNYNQLKGSSEQLHTNQDDLLKKLNYMIHLLEEQQDEKTNNVTEELILYLFLGVFVIFVIDSFVKVGKYRR